MSICMIRVCSSLIIPGWSSTTTSIKYVSPQLPKGPGTEISYDSFRPLVIDDMAWTRARMSKYGTFSFDEFDLSDLNLELGSS